MLRILQPNIASQTLIKVIMATTKQSERPVRSNTVLCLKWWRQPTVTDRETGRRTDRRTAASAPQINHTPQTVFQQDKANLAVEASV